MRVGVVPARFRDDLTDGRAAAAAGDAEGRKKKPYIVASPNQTRAPRESQQHAGQLAEYAGVGVGNGWSAAEQH